jgi:undecaprenyl pyrophosphate synthase
MFFTQTYWPDFNEAELDEINKIIEINKDEVKIEFKFYKNHQ